MKKIVITQIVGFIIVSFSTFSQNEEDQNYKDSLVREVYTLYDYEVLDGEVNPLLRNETGEVVFWEYKTFNEFVLTKEGDSIKIIEWDDSGSPTWNDYLIGKNIQIEYVDYEDYGWNVYSMKIVSSENEWDYLNFWMESGPMEMYAVLEDDFKKEFYYGPISKNSPMQYADLKSRYQNEAKVKIDYSIGDDGIIIRSLEVW